jgi:hypothetical protein
MPSTSSTVWALTVTARLERAWTLARPWRVFSEVRKTRARGCGAGAGVREDAGGLLLWGEDWEWDM